MNDGGSKLFMEKDFVLLDNVEVLKKWKICMNEFCLGGDSGLGKSSSDLRNIKNWELWSSTHDVS